MFEEDSRNTPNSDVYMYKGLHYRLGSFYAQYYAVDVWKESASVTNKELLLNGSKL